MVWLAADWPSTFNCRIRSDGQTNVVDAGVGPGLSGTLTGIYDLVKEGNESADTIPLNGLSELNETNQLANWTDLLNNENVYITALEIF